VPSVLERDVAAVVVDFDLKGQRLFVDVKRAWMVPAPSSTSTTVMTSRPQSL